jgi:tetratricopeptide (TPR) repeat protein
MKFKYYNLIKLTLLIFFISCSPKVYKNIGVLDGIKIKPDYLSYHRDSIRFTIEGLIPISYLNQDVKITLFPEYRYHNQVISLPEISAFDGTYTLATTQIKIKESYKFPYKEGMDDGQLILKSFVQQGTKSSNSEKILTQGIMTLPLLTRVGQIVMDEPIPKIGVFMTSDFSHVPKIEIKEYFLPFELGKGDIAESVWSSSELKKVLLEGLSGMKIQKIELVGISSPENSEYNQAGIEEKRVFSVREKIVGMIDRSTFELGISTRKRDWIDFRMLISDYQGISMEEKELLYQTITTSKPFEAQLKDIQKFKFYGKVAKDLYSKLRGVKVSVTFENTAFSDPAIAAKVYQLLKNGNESTIINLDQMAYAAQSSSKLFEKEAIYGKMTELFVSDLAFNNLGVVYLNQAQIELDPNHRKVLITKSIQAFKESNKIKANPSAFHNLGQAHLLNKNYFEAYVAISQASILEKDENNSFLRFNEGLRGALDIINGDYKLATVRLNNAPLTDVNLFNKGLAYFLSENYPKALEAFEDAIQLNRDYGYAFYGLALVAAYSDDDQAFFENLSKAVERSEYLKTRALVETSFKKYWNRTEFNDALKQ